MRPAAGPLAGSVALPGDKSISHRALLLGTLAEGLLQVRNLAPGADVASTRRCLEALGARFSDGPRGLRVRGLGLRGLEAPAQALDCGNSGTTMRLLMGALAGQPFASELVGDASLSRRPMRRVAAPLIAMGADIALSGAGTAPVVIRGRSLRGVRYRLPVPSAQVKSAVLLAGLFADGDTVVEDPFATRDHTERMLAFLSVGAAVDVAGERVRVRPHPLTAGAAKSLSVPGDPSSGAFFAAAAALVPDSRVELKRMLLNPTRLGFYTFLREMGAAVKIVHGGVNGREPVGDVVIEQRPLAGAALAADRIPGLIDELPVLAVLAATAAGESRFRGVGELRVKESDRLAGIIDLLTAVGAEARAEGDDLIVAGGARLRAAVVDAKGDHRMAMAAAVAGLGADAPLEIVGADCAAVSYPGFYDALEALRG